MEACAENGGMTYDRVYVSTTSFKSRTASLMQWVSHRLQSESNHLDLIRFHTIAGGLASM